MNQEISYRIVQQALQAFWNDPDRPPPSVKGLVAMTQQELVSRFRVRAFELHPDRAQVLHREPAELERAFKRLHAAYGVLSHVLADPALTRRIIGSSQQQEMSRMKPPSPNRYADRASRHANDARRAAANSAANSDDVRERLFYSGRVPTSELRFGQFLYYNGVIDWKTMIDAITWQYRMRPKVGEIGRAYRFLDFGSVSRILRISKMGEFFGAAAMRLGLIDRGQLCVMLGKQHLLNYPIGRFFLENDILSRSELEHLLFQNRRHNARYRSW